MRTTLIPSSLLSPDSCNAVTVTVSVPITDGASVAAAGILNWRIGRIPFADEVGEFAYLFSQTADLFPHVHAQVAHFRTQVAHRRVVPRFTKARGGRREVSRASPLFSKRLTWSRLGLRPPLRD